MCEILFRGKDVDDGKWIYGWYEMYPFERFPVRPCIIPSESAKGGYYEHVEVDPFTVCQYTSLTDKNGAKIFEGDIVEYQFDDDYPVYIGVVAFGKHCINDKIRAFGWFVDVTNENYYKNISLRENDCLRVIGNIHDNLELLEVK